MAWKMERCATPAGIAGRLLRAAEMRDPLRAEREIVDAEADLREGGRGGVAEDAAVEEERELLEAVAGRMRFDLRRSGSSGNSEGPLKDLLEHVARRYLSSSRMAVNSFRM